MCHKVPGGLTRLQSQRDTCEVDKEGHMAGKQLKRQTLESGVKFGEWVGASRNK